MQFNHRVYAGAALSISLPTALLLPLLAIVPIAEGLKDGLARTPQMGWNTWYSFYCNISEEVILSMADLIVDYGFKDLGYEYVLIDDCWSDGRNSTGNLQVNTTKFPNGMQDVTNRIHDLGLKAGIYGDAGNWTCGGYAGSLGHEEIDAETWASWGIDYVKYDNCNHDGFAGTPEISATRFKRMGNALNATGRPMLYSMCNWGEDYPWAWAQSVAHSWRMSGDVFDMFNREDPRCPCSEKEGLDCKVAGYYCSVMNVINKVAYFISKGGIGNWNDLDMLQAGQGGMTDDEYKLQFSVWAAVKSPFILSNDLRKIDPDTLSLLQNSAVIQVNQDELGQGANRRWRYYVDGDEHGPGEIQLWTSQLMGPPEPFGFDMLVLFLNSGSSPLRMNATSEQIWFDFGRRGTALQAQYAWDVYDLWGARMHRQTAQNIISQNGTVPETARWNATANGYKGWPQADNIALMGTHEDILQPGGTLEADVPAHGVRMFRLRVQNSGRDEL